MMDPTLAAALAHYRQALAEAPRPEASWAGLRFIVVDTESTGTNAHKDQIVSIGAVAVEDFQIAIDDTFEVMLPISHNTSSVMFHGITREEALDGMPEPEALAAFLHYLGGSVLVGHHVGHDVTILNVALERHFGIALGNLQVDTMGLTLKLRDQGILPGEEQGDPTRPDFTLDGLCRRFHITPHDRHTAAGDAFLTAQVLLKLLRAARRGGLDRLEDLRHPDPQA